MLNNIIGIFNVINTFSRHLKNYIYRDKSYTWKKNKLIAFPFLENPCNFIMTPIEVKKTKKKFGGGVGIWSRQHEYGEDNEPHK